TGVGKAPPLGPGQADDLAVWAVLPLLAQRRYSVREGALFEVLHTLVVMGLARCSHDLARNWGVGSFSGELLSEALRRRRAVLLPAARRLFPPASCRPGRADS